MNRSETRYQHIGQLFNNFEPTNQVSISMMLTDQSITATYTTSLSFDELKVNLSIKQNGKNSGSIIGSFDPKFTTSLRFNKTPTDLDLHIYRFFNAFYLNPLNLQKMKYNEKEFSQSIGNIDRNKLYKDLNKIYDEEIDFIGRTNYDAKEERISIKKEGRSNVIDAEGDGIKIATFWITSMMKSQNNLYLIEEIETFHHPSALREFITLILSICKQNNHQVIISTHSPEVLQYFSNSTETRIFHIKRIQEGNVAEVVSSENLKLFEDLGWNLGNLLRYERIVLVEGIDEIALFGEVFRKLHKTNPENLGISFLEARGFSNYKELLKTIASHDSELFIQHDFDDKSSHFIIKQLCNYLKELTNEGYTIIKDDDDWLILRNARNITKKLKKKNIILTGLQTEFSSFNNHAIEDYLIKILQNNNEIIRKMNGIESELANLSRNKGKDLLNDMFPSKSLYNIIIEILSHVDKSELPNELIQIISTIRSE